MNKTNIEWTNLYGEGTGRTWNCVSGCFHPCRNEYCYNTMKATSPLNRFGARYLDAEGNVRYEKDWKSRETRECHVAKKGEIFPYGYDPTFYPSRLLEPMETKGKHGIFVVDTGDLFGNWVDKEWIEQVLDVITKARQHTFFLLTKNPKKMLEFEFPFNAWVGTSVSVQEDVHRIATLNEVRANFRFVSFEPLKSHITADLSKIDWAIIGAQTGVKAPQPTGKMVGELIGQSRDAGAKVFLKNNLGYGELRGLKGWKEQHEYPDPYHPTHCKCGGTYVVDDTWASRRRCNACGDWYDW